MKERDFHFIFGKFCSKLAQFRANRRRSLACYSKLAESLELQKARIETYIVRWGILAGTVFATFLSVPFALKLSFRANQT